MDTSSPDARPGPGAAQQLRRQHVVLEKPDAAPVQEAAETRRPSVLEDDRQGCAAGIEIARDQADVHGPKEHRAPFPVQRAAEVAVSSLKAERVPDKTPYLFGLGVGQLGAAARAHLSVGFSGNQ